MRPPPTGTVKFSEIFFSRAESTPLQARQIADLSLAPRRTRGLAAYDGISWRIRPNRVAGRALPRVLPAAEKRAHLLLEVGLSADDTTLPEQNIRPRDRGRDGLHRSRANDSILLHGRHAGDGPAQDLA